MDYYSFTNAGLMKMLKGQTYKKHIIKNIEIIGQRKLVILGDGDGINAEVLKKSLAQLKKKGVRVPDTAFMVTNDERTLKPGDDSIRSISELEGKTKAYYVLVTSSYDDTEVYLKGLTGRIGSAQTVEKRLKSMGYTDRDYCLVNKPIGLLEPYMKFKTGRFKSSQRKLMGQLEAPVRRTESQLKELRDKYKGKRCFILGYKQGVKSEEINLMMNERCIAYNGICNFFTKTPMRPSQYILSDGGAYLGNGKYIEGMESFVASNISVFEDKFTKKPTYFNIMGSGFIPELPSFGSTQHTEALRRIDDLYIALQLALYQGFSEIYIYCFDGVYDAQITEFDEAIVTAEGNYSYPAAAKELLTKVKDYAEKKGVTIYRMNDTENLDMFPLCTFDEIDFSTAKVLSKI